MKKDNIKKLLLIMVINFLVQIMVLLIVTHDKYQKDINNTNNIILQLINQDEIESVKILNNEQPNYHKADLSKYGILDNHAVISSMNTLYKKNLVIDIVLLFVLDGLLTILFCCLIIQYNKRIIRITNYAKQLNEGEYELLIADNNEVNLSKLKNYLYKITTTLKEENRLINRQKTNLKESISDISHQIKTPLTSLNVLISSLNSPNMDNKTRNDFLQEMEHEINKIDFLVITLLKLARFDAGVIVLKKEPIKVYELFCDIQNNLAVSIELKSIKVVTKCSKKIQFIGDYKWECEALTNILKNCLEHTPCHNKIYLSCVDNVIYTKIIIKDEGEGIAKEDINHIFERFYKAKNSSSDSIGIGLSLAQTIIKQDNGYITVQSEPNKGTIFEIKYIK